MTYSPVYSAAFILYSSEAPNTTFEVPDGFTAVVRYASIEQDIGSYAWLWGIQNSTEAPLVRIYGHGGIGAGESDIWRGRVVVPAGGVISVYVTEFGTYPGIYVGGYLLRNVVE